MPLSHALALSFSILAFKYILYIWTQGCKSSVTNLNWFEPEVHLFSLHFFKFPLNTFVWTWAALSSDMDKSAFFPSRISVSCTSSSLLLKVKDVFKVDESSLLPVSDKPGYACINIIENRIYIRGEFKESLGMNFFRPFQPEREFKVYKSCKCSQIICSRVH